jgi:branched-chain amino acid aminotransferase
MASACRVILRHPASEWSESVTEAKDSDRTWVWIDDGLGGSPRPAAEARVPVLDRGFLYGDSVYEVTRTFAGVPRWLDRHLDRLERSAQGLELLLPPRGHIEAAIASTLQAARAASTGELYLRVVVTRGAGGLGLDPALADAPRLIVIARPVQPPPPEAYRDGVAVMLSNRVRSAPSLKTGNYLESVLAVREARRVGAHEALLRDALGRITEGSSSNVFTVRGGRVVTPPLAAGLLPGITRAALLDLLRGDGIAVDEVPLWPADLAAADEAFLSSSIRGVLPVVRCDGNRLGDGRPGPITRQAMSLYARATEGS